MNTECLISLEQKKNKPKQASKKAPTERLFQLQISVSFSGELSVETLLLHTCVAFLYIIKNGDG